MSVPLRSRLGISALSDLESSFVDVTQVENSFAKTAVIMPKRNINEVLATSDTDILGKDEIRQACAPDIVMPKI